VRALNVATGKYVHFSNADCGFAYRESAFKRELAGQHIVTRVEFALGRNGAPAVRYGELARALHAEASTSRAPSLTDVVATVRQLRAKKSMLHLQGDENSRSCGSFFVNPVVPKQALERIRAVVGSSEVPNYPQAHDLVKLPAAWLIEHAGLQKGHREGSVGLSTRHTLALVCHDGATAQDVVSFAGKVRARVEARFGVRLVVEPAFCGFQSLDAGLPRQTP
jgi:UDP-N-acetylmuramate dehydrogenase